MTGFNCTACGHCCAQINRLLDFDWANHWPWMQKLVDDFPYAVREDGSCEMLNGTLCSVYEDRPLLCSIERTADEVDIGMSKQQWFMVNEQSCKQLQNKALRRSIGIALRVA